MKIESLVLLGITLCLLALWVTAYSIENGDVNAISMYFLVYGVVAVVLGILNGFILKFVEKKTHSWLSLVGFGVLPMVIFYLMYVSGISRIKFIGEFGLIGIGLTNLIWITQRILHRKKNTSV